MRNALVIVSWLRQTKGQTMSVIELSWTAKKRISEQACKINLDQTIPTLYRALQKAFLVKASKDAKSPSFEDTNSNKKLENEKVCFPYFSFLSFISGHTLSRTCKK